MNIRLEGAVWIINDGEYYIGEGESTAYVVSNYDGETVYSSDDFECCLVWINNSIWGGFILCILEKIQAGTDLII